MSALKKDIRDLSIEQLKKRKESIANFMLDFPKNPRNEQGWITLTAIDELIRVKESKDEFVEMVIRELFFEE